MALRLVLLIAPFLARLGNGQSETPVPTCDGCYVAPAYTEISVYGTSVSDSKPTVYMIFTAYSLTSAFISSDLCVTTSGSSIPFSPQCSISKAAMANPTSFLSTAASQFIKILGLGGCEVSGSTVVLFTTAGSTTFVDVGAPTFLTFPTIVTLLGTAVPNPATQTLSTSTSKSSPSPPPTSSLPTATTALKTANPTPLPSPILPTHTKVAISIVVPVFVLELLFAGVLLCHRRRKSQRTVNEHATTSQEDGQFQEDTQPHLQQKAELEAEEKPKYELEAQERRYEIGSGEERYEMSAEEGESKV